MPLVLSSPPFCSSHLRILFPYTALSSYYTLSLHDALPIFFQRPVIEEDTVLLVGCQPSQIVDFTRRKKPSRHVVRQRSEEHTSELQSPCNLVCRLLLEKKNSAVRGISI